MMRQSVPCYPSRDGVEPVPRLWPNSTIVCIGGGPSLRAEDVDFCRGKAKVIAVNDAHRLAPWADVLYAGDGKWWRHYGGVPGFAGLKYSVQADAGPGVRVLRGSALAGLDRDPSCLRTGKNSGYQAMNLAVHLGASRIVLLGYDMQALKGPEKSHWFGPHPPQIRSAAPYASFVVQFAALVQPLQELGIEVFNCSRETALHCFPRTPLAQVLSDA